MIFRLILNEQSLLPASDEKNIRRRLLEIARDHLHSSATQREALLPASVLACVSFS
jgi:hypothetical protein